MDKDRNGGRAGSVGAVMVKDEVGRTIEQTLYSVKATVRSVIDRLEGIVNRAGGAYDGDDEPAIGSGGLLGHAREIDNMVARAGYLISEIEKHV